MQDVPSTSTAAIHGEVMSDTINHCKYHGSSRLAETCNGCFAEVRSRVAELEAANRIYHEVLGERMHAIADAERVAELETFIRGVLKHGAVDEECPHVAALAKLVEPTASMCTTPNGRTDGHGAYVERNASGELVCAFCKKSRDGAPAALGDGAMPNAGTRLREERDHYREKCLGLQIDFNNSIACIVDLKAEVRELQSGNEAKWQPLFEAAVDLVKSWNTPHEDHQAVEALRHAVSVLTGSEGSNG